MYDESICSKLPIVVKGLTVVVRFEIWFFLEILNVILVVIPWGLLACQEVNIPMWVLVQIQFGSVNCFHVHSKKTFVIGDGNVVSI